ncbi:hypothetical protein [Acidaminobacterium chupaoyuni]
MATSTAAAQAGLLGAGPGETTWLESLDVQIFMLAVGGAATLLGMTTLEGIKEKNSGRCPDKNYDYLDTLPKINSVLILTVAVYFLYLAWMEDKRKSKNTLLSRLLLANIFAVAAAVIKTDAAYRPKQTAVDIEEEVE